MARARIVSVCPHFLSFQQRSVSAAAVLAIALLFVAKPVFAAQTWRDKNVYFGDMHWHSCLSQDAARETTLTSQYESMLYDYGLDFSMESDHAEGATAGILFCDTYLPFVAPLKIYSGEEIATAMKQAADDWNGAEYNGITFVTFPGYEWAPDARCWQATATNPFPNDLNSDDNTPGHINYFFSSTQGWTYHDDVWEPGDGDSTICAGATDLGLTYYEGSKDWVDEILGQLIHQRDDPDRSYDLIIQYNHPAASIDKGGSSDHLAKWYDFEHSNNYCSVGENGPDCVENQCEAVRRAYGVTTVEWYANQEAAIGSREQHGEDEDVCTGEPLHDILSEGCYHQLYHIADRYVMSRGLREGYDLASIGGSDSHSGRRFKPSGNFPGGRGAGSRSLAVVYAADATREAIWDGLTHRHTYGLSRLREQGPVHKGRVDFYTPEPDDAGGIPTPEFVMGDTVQSVPEGVARSFTISAASETGVTDVVPVELRLYRVGPNTPLTERTDPTFYWLDDLEDDPGKFGELLGIFPNSTASTTLTHTFTNVTVYPGDAIFAVVPYSDYTWIDDFYSTEPVLDPIFGHVIGQSPLDADENGEIDPGKTGYPHSDDNTWARTTPIFFEASQETPQVSPVCAHVEFSGSGTLEAGVGGGDGGLDGDASILPVAIPGGYDVEWDRWRFTLPRDYAYVDLSFFTQKDEDNTGHLFGIRIDGQLVYSGRAGIDHDADTIVEKKNIPFPLKKGIHEMQVHMDDQEYANGDNDPDFHCNDYDGPPGFVDAMNFHNDIDAVCGDITPPEITCPDDVTLECNTTGGASATTGAIATFLGGATATDDKDSTPTITTDAPTFFGTGATTVTFTATDDSGNAATCTASVTVNDTTPPQLAAFALSPSTLAPPKHKMMPITVPTLVATDICDAAPTIRCSVTSSEPPNGTGDGDQPIDIIFNGQNIATQGTGERQITTTAGRGSFTLQLRAERAGSSKPRTYTTACVGVDGSGNRSTTRTAAVVVPK